MRREGEREGEGKKDEERIERGVGERYIVYTHVEGGERGRATCRRRKGESAR